MSAKKLSNGEKKVISAYNGNAKETSKACKLAPAYVRRLLTLPYILEGIKAREEKENADGKNPLIADRSERQAFWSSVMNGEPQLVGIEPKMKDGDPVLDDDDKPVMENVYKIPSMKDRLKAAELLGKSNADFVEKRILATDPDNPLEFKQTFTTIEEVEAEMKRRGLPIPE